MTVWAKGAGASSIAGVAIACAALGCADMQPMQARECGNGVLEPGEDCDLATDPAAGASAACGAPSGPSPCRYICSGEAECPPGWGCGLDGVCRWATGEFGHARPTSILGAEGWAVGRVDQDEIPDLLVALDRELQVHLGDGDGGFSLAHVLRLPRQTGAPAFADLDADGRLDAAALLETGLLTIHTEPDGKLVPGLGRPFDLGKHEAAEFVAAQVEGIDGDLLLAFVQQPAEYPDDLVAQFVWPLSDDDDGEFLTGPAVLLPELRNLGQLAGARIPRTHPQGDPNAKQTLLALSFRNHDTVWLVETRLDDAGGHEPRPRAFLVQELQLPYAVDKGGVQFADVDGDGFPDLLVSAEGQVLVAEGAGDGTFATASVDGRFDALPAQDTVLPGLDLGQSVWPRAAADLNGDGIADYVGQNGVFVTNPATCELTQVAYRTVEEPWDQVVIADLNRDGRPDVAASSRTPTASVRGVDLLLNSGSPGFSHTRINTSGAVSALAAGDFDSDGIGDLAVVEEVGAALGTDLERVSVIFGRTDSMPDAAVAMGDFPAKSAHIAPGLFRFRTGFLDLAHDLVVDLGTEDRTTWYSLMWGGSEKQLFTPTHVGTSPRAVVPGRFGGSSQGALDLLVVTETDDESSAQVFSSAGEVISGRVSLPFEDDWSCRLSEVEDLDDDGIDEWIVLTSSRGIPGTCTGVHGDGLWITTFAGGIIEVPAKPLGLSGPHEQPIDAVLDDFDGDSRPDLALAFDGGSAQTRGVSVFWNNQGHVDGSYSTAIRGLAGEPDVALLAALNADDEPTPELVVLNGEGLHLVHFGADRYLASTPSSVPIENPKLRTSMRTADLAGDGVEDLLIASSEPPVVEVRMGLDHTNPCARDEAAQVIYLNRHGGFYMKGNDDAVANTSSIIPHDTELRELSGGPGWNDVVACVQGAFANFRVRVTEEDPGDRYHLEVVVTGNSAAVFGLDADTTSMSPHLCTGVSNGIGFVFAPVSQGDPQTLCTMAAASAGIMLGLEWTAQCNDIMGFDLSCAGTSFLNQDAPCGTTERAPCKCGGSTQNSYARLLEFLGETLCPAD